MSSINDFLGFSEKVNQNYVRDNVVVADLFLGMELSQRLVLQFFDQRRLAFTQMPSVQSVLALRQHDGS